MPNWCENDLVIHGKPDAVEAVLNFIGMREAEPVFGFNRVIPYPEKFAQMDAESRLADAASRVAYKLKYGTEIDGYNAGGYDWCIANWGTKWNVKGDVRETKQTRGVKLSFETPWSPPINVITTLGARFPAVKLQMRYYECGAGFKGHITVIGNVTDNITGNYSGPRGG